MQHFDLYTPVAAVLFFTFLTTLRFSFSGHFQARDPVSRIVTNPAWLYPLILSGPWALGAFYHAAISPWPPQTFEMIAGKDGAWAGAAAAIAAATADVWLLWATATVFRRFSPPHDHRMIKYYYVVNLVVGGYLMARFLHVIDMGAAGIIPS
jgi:hypothetical protein